MSSTLNQCNECDRMAAKVVELTKLLDRHGVCLDCGEMFGHEIDAPFAACDCKNSEWNSFTPYMRLQKRIKELQLKLDNPMQVLNVEPFDPVTMQRHCLCDGSPVKNAICGHIRVNSDVCGAPPERMCGHQRTRPKPSKMNDPGGELDGVEDISDLDREPGWM